MQGEILAGADKETRNIQVVPVARNNLASIAAWPVPPQAGMSFGGWPSGGVRGHATSSIAPGDALSVTIWDNEDNSLLTTTAQKSVQLTEVTVGNDGTIFVPYVGKVNVRGLSPDQARERVQSGVEAVLPSGQVQLSVKQGRLNTVDLVGGVSQAGSYPLPDRNFSVLSLISQGGGVSDALQNPIVKLVRGGRSYGISVSRLFAQPALDVSLIGGDKVIVEDDPRYFLALGAAGKQSTMPFPQDEVSALDAVSMIGGLSANRANPRGVLILREYAGNQVRLDGRGPDRTRVVFTVDLTTADGLFSARNFRIANGDLVLATESPVTSTRTVFGLVGQIFGLSDQLNSN
ncbi:polysaccharide export outer membrane protein [Gemmobacter megaterium]|uniref:Polysaccharide export outer membrane protein n=1 Tax=Gemmobacter megaterium TaxID=1086013 RepID=A0A1N7P8M3_9RHOB|nr:polysaccharide biosynthesis/export family protein [Gemmobacter megaterium]GGE19841.1 polysaccharide biosynthesis protein [Gemmobacter megaterium]SIT06942.1 polysaccharide export outer membrane protein [Gemmobacter megaterium]